MEKPEKKLSDVAVEKAQDALEELADKFTASANEIQQTKIALAAKREKLTRLKEKEQRQTATIESLTELERGIHIAAREQTRRAIAATEAEIKEFGDDEDDAIQETNKIDEELTNLTHEMLKRRIN